VPYLHPFRKQYRENTKMKKGGVRVKLLQDLETHGWTDYFDAELYKTIRQIFYSRCREYNIATIQSSM
jgi:hypothetical protein